MRLLECIREQGSISRGAQAAGISYKSAWDAVKDMNTLAGQPLVASETGGKGGGGARLTPYGERLLKIYALLGRIERMAVNALQDESASSTACWRWCRALACRPVPATSFLHR
ncbi:LysR family transcriptional regulator [Oceanimonas sp. NS1]|nr:LysR family transcriptional regulator [Oceanimonas sp. NS1]